MDFLWTIFLLELVHLTLQPPIKHHCKKLLFREKNQGTRSKNGKMFVSLQGCLQGCSKLL
jgi:hypothetical protein